jgi:peptidyl-prolyl cis-trans isomerase SurA
MKFACGLLATFGILISLLSGGCSPGLGDLVVLELGPSHVNLADYQSFYLKNSGNLEAAKKSSQEEREHFLDLLTNYKLKLQDAYDRNLLNDPDIQKELKEYRTSLASSFILEKELTEPGVRQMYERKKQNIRAEHILISVRQDAPPEDTLKAYRKAVDIINLTKTQPFDSLVAKYSEDPSAKQNHGDLYYFTGGVMVKAFEDAAYGMKTGEISKVPARSTFGYHIIKILNIEPAHTIKVRHIMARFQTTTPDSADSVNALTRIRGIRDSLKRGWDFAKLAIKLSEDPGSAAQGGELPWFDRRRFIEPFEDAAFPLTIGQTSGIVRTPFGFHIIKLDSVQDLPPYEQIHDQLKSTYQKNRYGEDYSAYIADLKTECGYTFNEDAFSAFIAQLDSTKTTDDSAWDATVSADVRKLPVMTIGNTPIRIDSILDVLTKKIEYRDIALRKAELRPKFDRIAESFLLDRKSIGLEERNKEFSSLMKEYTDGVVLYKAEQLEVWNKTSVTDSGLKSFYDQNRDKFVFPEQVNINEIIFDSDTTALTIYDSLVHGADFAGIASRWNTDAKLREKKGARGLVSVDADEASKRAAKLAIGEISEPVEFEHGGYAIVQLLGKEAPHAKTFEEAGAEVSNQYQESESKRLEESWLEKVKLRYPVKQYKENLKGAFQSN